MLIMSYRSLIFLYVILLVHFNKIQTGGSMISLRIQIANYNCILIR